MSGLESIFSIWRWSQIPNAIFGKTMYPNHRKHLFPTKYGHGVHFAGLQSVIPFCFLTFLSATLAIDLYVARSWHPYRLRTITTPFNLSGVGISIITSPWGPREEVLFETPFLVGSVRPCNSELSVWVTRVQSAVIDAELIHLPKN